jgi:hypothetical protein
MQRLARRLSVGFSLVCIITVCLHVVACESAAEQAARAKGEPARELTDSQVEDLVRRSWQYVAMYNVNNKGAMQYGGWNLCDVDTELKDHTLQLISRPNNDSLYITCMFDLRKDPVVLDMPAFDSKYVSLMITGYDHYVNIPMSTRQGDFQEPEKMLIFTERTEDYERDEQVEGVDRTFEATGDFVSAVFRVMPHANERERFERVKEQMQAVKLLTLSELRGRDPKPIDDVAFPSVGQQDVDIFEDNLLEVMQFVFNHTTFDPEGELDRAILAAYEPLGVVPGRTYDPGRVANLDGQRIRKVASRIEAEEMAKADRLAASTGLFKRKGEIGLDLLLFQSVFGPIGQPAVEAVYPAVSTADGEPLNAQHDYVIRMSADEMPPAEAFWSLTLYDTENGFFIPNDRKKYSVGENGGMKLDEDGGIAVYIAEEKPESVPEENWLPLNRGDYGIDVVLRLYVPDLEAFETWTPPKAQAF